MMCLGRRTAREHGAGSSCIAVVALAKCESAHTMRLLPAQAAMSFVKTMVPCDRSSPSPSLVARWCSAVMTTLKLRRTPLRPRAAFWNSPSFSGFRSTATYIGRPFEFK